MMRVLLIKHFLFSAFAFFPARTRTTHIEKFGVDIFSAFSDVHVTPQSSRIRTDYISIKSSVGDQSQDGNVEIYAPIRPIQKRNLAKERKPRGYWQNLGNVRQEIFDQWLAAGVELRPNAILIPNQSLLYHWKRHDLRWAIHSYFGADQLAEDFQEADGNVSVLVIPGRWKEAVRKFQAVRELIANDPTLSPHHSPMRRARKRKETTAAKRNETKEKADRKPHKYWNDENVMEEMNEYLQWRKETRGRPAVWMPRDSEIESDGRRTLKHGLHKCDNARRAIVDGMVPYRDWAYFEGWRELMIYLKEYLEQESSEEHAKSLKDGSPMFFPFLKDVQATHPQLNSLIKYYGGRKFVAAKLGMRYSQKPPTKAQIKNFKEGSLSGELYRINFGPFNLDFGIALVDYIRNGHMELSPLLPKGQAAMIMPTAEQLKKDGMEWLDADIMKYGGYENVARRLQLEIAEGK